MCKGCINKCAKHRLCWVQKNKNVGKNSRISETKVQDTASVVKGDVLTQAANNVKSYVCVVLTLAAKK